MTPRFALSLDQHGIELLVRVPDGWDRLGEVPPEAPDLADRLVALRARAEDIAGRAPVCRVVIPGDQIRFVTLDDGAADRDAVEAAIDGTTPYALHELEIDHISSGGRARIAAVATETLDEARAFAAQHGFETVCFVAATQAGDAEFLFAADRGVEREPIAPVATGTYRAPAPLPPAPTKPAAETEPTEKADALDAPDDTPEPGAPPHGALAAAALPGGDTPETVDAEDTPATEAEDAVAIPATHPDGAPPAPSAPARKAPVADRTAKGGDTPPLQATRAAPVGGAPTEPLFTRRKEPVPVGKGKAASGPALRAEAAPDPARRSALAAAAMAPDDIDYEDDAPDLPPRARAQAPRAKGAAGNVFATPPARTGAARFTGLILTGVLLLVLLLVGFWASTLPDEGISWLWGGDDTAVAEAGSERPAGSPAVAEIAVPERVVIDTPAPASPLPETVDAPAPAPSALAERPVTAEAPPLPVVRAASDGILTPAEADRIYAATGVYQRAPRIPVQPRADVAEAARPTSSPLRAVPQIERPGAIVPVRAVSDVAMEAPVGPPPQGAEFDYDRRGRILATAEGTVLPSGVVIYAGAPEMRPRPRPGTPEPAPVVVGAADPDQPEEVRLIEGPAPVQPPLRPADAADAVSAETAADAPQDGTGDEAARVTIDTPAPATTDVAEAPSTATVPDEGGTQASSEGDVLAALEEATAPAAAQDSPVAVVQGAPPRRPSLRPEALVPAQVQPMPAWLEARRPPLRPEDLAPPADLADAATEEEEIAETAEALEAPAADINAITAALAAAAEPSPFMNRTARAVGLIRRPDARPRDMAQIVARASAQPARRQTEGVVQRPAPAPAPAASAPATARPVGAPPASVARAATQDNAINLRQMNLIGVYGRPNARRALVRLGNGRYVKVEVGSALDGGRVTAIGDNALNFVKGGRTYALQLPTG